MRRRESERCRARPGPVGSLGIAAAGILLLTIPVHAADVSGRLSLGTIYSDNLSLAPSGEEDGGMVYLAEPNIVIAATGRRYDFQLDYTLQALYYPDQPDTNEAYSQGTTSLELELIEEHLFLNSQAGVDQVVIDPAQPFSFGNIPQIGNRSNATRYQTGPEWRQEILGSTLDITTAIGQINYGDADLQDANYQSIDTNWEGPEKDRGLSWSVHHAYQSYSYEVSPDAKLQLLEFSLFYNMPDGWAPFATGGRESDVFDRSSAALTDNIWSVGVRKSSPRSEFEASAGERSFGSTWSASFRYQYGGDSGDFFRIGYEESPQTTESIDNSLAFPPTDPGAPPPPPGPVVPPGLNGPGTGTYYLRKHGTLVVARTFNRNIVSLNAFYDQTKNIPQDGVSAPDRTEEKGASLLWTYKVGSRTDVTVEAYGANRDFNQGTPQADSDTHLRSRLTGKYRIGERTDVSAWVGRDQVRGSDTESNNYTENQVGLMVGRNF
jgi:hypothetical protein